MPLDAILAGISARCARVRTGVDIGFADAAVSACLRERIPALWMTVEKEAAALQSAKATLAPESVHALGSDETLPFDGNQFELAVLNGALISQSLVREIHRVLKPAGLLFFSVEETVRRGPGSTLSQLYNAVLKNGYDIVSVMRPHWWHFGRDGKTLTICARKKNWREQRPLKIIGAIVCALGLLNAFANEASESLVKLLNSRSCQSPKAYATAVESVRTLADRGGVLQRYVIAIVSTDDHAPAAAKLSEKQRRAWLDGSREWIRQMAEQKDNALAWYLLSLESNDIAMLEHAAKGDNVQALNAWGTILVAQALSTSSTNSVQTEAKLKEGFLAFGRAAGKKDANGMYNLGMCHLQGYGCKADPAKAFEWFCVAAENGHPEAINNIGGFYRDGIVVMTNAAMSVKWFKKSADLGNPYGQLNYALALQRGDGAPKDEEEAAKFFRSSAEQGCAEAMAAYGMCFHHGRGVKKDPETAFQWFKRSAEAGFPPAMDNLAICYERGTGTEKDVLKSALWKMRSRAAMGDADARAWVERMSSDKSER